MAFFDLLVEKFETKVYSTLLENVKKQVVDKREVFAELNLAEQCKTLMEILKAFNCNAKNPNLTSIGGTSGVKPKARTMSLEKCSSVHLINQSVTGLYETSIDLLG